MHPRRAWLESKLQEKPDQYLGTSARFVARMDSSSLVGNYRAIQDLVPGQSILPMVKANGYGHGSAWVARELAHMQGLYGVGVATFEEGLELRRELGPRFRKLRIIVFSGATPWTEEKGQICEQSSLTPVIATDRDWTLFLKQGWPERISYELKFNTGMNRLGLSLATAPSVARALRSKPAEWHPEGILSHLAIGETPDAKVSVSQREKFVWLKQELSGVFPAAHFHLANSAGIWNHKNWGLKDLTDVVRPGLALYGVTPWKGAPERGIVPVMTLQASVLTVHRLKPGEAVGYGATFKSEGSGPTWIAVLGAGYADGISRVLSGKGHLWIHGKASKFAGRISMDLSSAICPEGTKPGEWAEILGPHIDPWAQAAAAETIPYELLTSVSTRVQRIYG